MVSIDICLPGCECVFNCNYTFSSRDKCLGRRRQCHTFTWRVRALPDEDDKRKFSLFKTALFRPVALVLVP